MQTKPKMKYQSTPVRLSTVEKKIIPNVDADVGKEELLQPVGGNVK